MKAKGLTYEEVMQLALEHYEEGGDMTYECWDEKDYQRVCDFRGRLMTKKEVLQMFRDDEARRRDIQLTAW
jgi:hypothetical protein